MSDELILRGPAPLQAVPIEYAEKAMASLMSLHSELMEEKERRVDLYRRLMEKEQAVAELKMYVKMLEEKLGRPRTAVGPAPPAPVAVPAPRMVRVAPPPPPAAPAPLPRPISIAHARTHVHAVPPPHPPSPPAAPPAAKATGSTRRPQPTDGWKTW